MGLWPTTPLQAAGIRMDPPWSPPSAMSTCPVARTTALPFEDAPGAWVGLRGFRTGPSAQV